MRRSGGIGYTVVFIIGFAVFVAVWIYRLTPEINVPLPAQEVLYRVYATIPYDVLLVTLLLGVVLSAIFALGRFVRPFKK